MQITGVEPVVVSVTDRGDWVFLLLHTDVGITGLGEASHSGDDAVLLAILDMFGQQIQGESPSRIGAIWQRLARFDGGRVAHTALSAIEQALWDILGQHLGAPIHSLFGGAVRERLRLYANINRHVRDRTPPGFARAARQAVDEGFTAIKLAPFDELWEPDHIRTGPSAAWRPGVARVEAVREAIGDDVDLAVDCHGRMEASEAIIVAQALSDCHLLWYEEPVPHTQVEALSRVSQAITTPTASAESVFGLEHFRPFLCQRVVDIIMPDVKHAGGLLETRNIASAARMNQLLVAPHNPSGPVSTVATAHVACTLRNFLILEYAWHEVDWRADLLIPSEPVRGGHLLVSDAPGLGYRLNPDVVDAHRLRTPRSGNSSRIVPDTGSPMPLRA